MPVCRHVACAVLAGVLLVGGLGRPEAHASAQTVSVMPISVRIEQVIGNPPTPAVNVRRVATVTTSVPNAFVAGCAVVQSTYTDQNAFVDQDTTVLDGQRLQARLADPPGPFLPTPGGLGFRLDVRVRNMCTGTLSAEVTVTVLLSMALPSNLPTPTPNPVLPTLTAVVDSATTTATVTVTTTGPPFIPDCSVVYIQMELDGQPSLLLVPRPTTFVSATQLVADLQPSDFASNVSRLQVFVYNACSSSGAVYNPAFVTTRGLATPVVPELPPPWLFVSGLLALGGLARRRRRRS